MRSLANIGEGCPDLLVGWGGENHLFEVKDGKAPKSQQRLTADEFDFHVTWCGIIHVVRSPEEAIAVLEEE